jgi:hypothetical protein
VATATAGTVGTVGTVTFLSSLNRVHNASRSVHSPSLAEVRRNVPAPHGPAVAVCFCPQRIIGESVPYGGLYVVRTQMTPRMQGRGPPEVEASMTYIYIYKRNPWLLRVVSSGMLRRVTLVRTNVSEELSASFIRVTRIGELRTTLVVTSNRRTLRRYTKTQKTPFFIVTAVKTSDLTNSVAFSPQANSTD